jgi:hypothetical protein
MTPLLSLSADFVLLAGLAAALTSPRISPPARPMIAIFAFACAWLMTAVLDAMRAPGWTVVLGGAVVVVSIVVVAATLQHWTQGDDGADGEQGERGGRDGGGPTIPSDI